MAASVLIDIFPFRITKPLLQLSSSKQESFSLQQFKKNKRFLIFNYLIRNFRCAHSVNYNLTVFYKNNTQLLKNLE